MISFDELLAHLETINNITDPILKAYTVEAIAKEIGLSVETLQQMLKDYQRQQAEKASHSSFWRAKFWKIESFFERLNESFAEMDIFIFLDYLSRLSIIVGIFFFVGEWSGRREARLNEEKQTIYQSWEVIRNNQDKSSGSDLITALQDLNEAKQPLTELNLSDKQLSNIDKPLNLKKAWLVGAKFDKASLNNAIFDQAELPTSSFVDANLMWASFKSANLYHANLAKASLNEADLRFSNLQQTDFQGAILKDAKFQKANLTNVIFKSCDLEGANFRGAIGLEVNQIKSASNWQKAIFSDDFLAKLK